MANEIKTITAELTGVKQQKAPKPHQYDFINPEGSTFPLTVGAFPNKPGADGKPVPSGLPQLEIGKIYTFKCEYKPNKEGNGFHKNFVRKSYDGPYDITEVPAGTKTGIQGGPKPKAPIPADNMPQPEEGPAPKPITPTTRTTAPVGYLPAQRAPYVDPKEKYWEDRAKADAARERAMQRGGYSHDAATITAAYIRVLGHYPTEAENKIILDFQITMTDALVDAAEKKEEERKTGKKAPEPAQDSDEHLDIGGEPTRNKPAKGGSA